MILNLRLEGFPEEILNEMVDKKIVSNKSEAIRLTILHYNEHFRIKSQEQYLEDLSVIKKVQFLEQEVKDGKIKTLTKEDVLKKYPHLRDD